MVSNTFHRPTRPIQGIVSLQEQYFCQTIELIELEGTLVMLLAQTQWDSKETCARHCVCAWNNKHMVEFAFIERYAVLFCQLTKWSHKHTLCDASFVNLENGRLRACRVAHLGQCAL